jgi:hypothetical protein
METTGQSLSNATSWETMERSIHEINALAFIYGDESEADQDRDEATTHSFSIAASCQDAFSRIRKMILEEEETADLMTSQLVPPDGFQIEIQTTVEEDDASSVYPVSIKIRLPNGYPEYNHALLSSLTVMPQGTTLIRLKRSTIDNIVSTVNNKSQELIGNESLLDIIEMTKELLLSAIIEERSSIEQQSSSSNRQSPADEEMKNRNGFGRRWIWVHHITNANRRKDIIKEANSLQLHGYLKYGYPGIVVIEGTITNCNTFVVWIKGNKSRPGGFGRNWGHHVRGEIDYDDDDDDDDEGHDENDTKKKKKQRWLCLPSQFSEMEDLAELANECKNCGLQDEFLEFVMQHK